jgi:protein-L-isoaspartate(D-aspartate) O-methyltransferase
MLDIADADFAARRARMVREQIARRGIMDERVLAAMRKVPREAFLPPELAEFAYDDTPLPIGAEQTISQPFIVPMMIEAAEVDPRDRALDVGTGSGYAAVVLSLFASEVFTIERHPVLFERARQRFEAWLRMTVAERAR